MSYCKVCCGECNTEIHQATLDVRKWFREEVSKGRTITKDGDKKKSKRATETAIRLNLHGKVDKIK